MLELPEKIALYFGCRDRAGHFLHSGSTTIYDIRNVRDFPWRENHLDGGLLKNGKHPDAWDGKVFWTCGGRAALWLAFFWWDNSVDRRGQSNAGFYVRGFDIATRQEAFDFACAAYPWVVARQRQPLVLQDA